MNQWSSRWAGKWTKSHPHGLVTHGSTEPILTVLDVRGFEIRDMFLIGINDNCGSIVFSTEERANAAKAALEPAYRVKVRLERGQWFADYDRRDLDGSVPSWLVRDIVMKDGTVVMRAGCWVRGGAQ